MKRHLARLAFWWMYLTGRSRWDTGQTPPEITRLVEERHLDPGRAVDLGCGTGTTSVYLAEHGWSVTGVDFIPAAIRQARRKARRAGVADRTHFYVGDVTRLADLGIAGPFDLAVDIGCAHSLSDDALTVYARQLSRIVRPGGLYMLYMFRPTPQTGRGLPPDAVVELFAPDFRLCWSDLGDDSQAGRASAWYQFERNPSA